MAGGFGIRRDYLSIIIRQGIRRPLGACGVPAVGARPRNRGGRDAGKRFCRRLRRTGGNACAFGRALRDAACVRNGFLRGWERRIRFADAGAAVRRRRSVYQRRRYFRQTAAAAPRRSGCGCVRRAPKDGLSLRIFCFSPNERQERSGISLRYAFLQSPRPAAGRFFVIAVCGRLFILPS